MQGTSVPSVIELQLRLVGIVLLAPTLIIWHRDGRQRRVRANAQSGKNNWPCWIWYRNFQQQQSPSQIGETFYNFWGCCPSMPSRRFCKIHSDELTGIVSGFENMFECAWPVKRMKVLQIPYVDRDICKLTHHSPVTETMFCSDWDRWKTSMEETPMEPNRDCVCFVTGIISWGEGRGRWEIWDIHQLAKFPSKGG